MKKLKTFEIFNQEFGLEEEDDFPTPGSTNSYDTANYDKYKSEKEEGQEINSDPILGDYDDGYTPEFWMNEYGVDSDAAEELSNLADEVLSMNNLDDRMDAVEQFFFSGLIDDENIASEIEGYFKDMVIG